MEIQCDKCGLVYEESELLKVSKLDTSEFVGVICTNCYSKLENYKKPEEDDNQMTIFDYIEDSDVDSTN